VYESHEDDTPKTVVINEALEIARQFSTYEATQFISSILDAIAGPRGLGHGVGREAICLAPSREICAKAQRRNLESENAPTPGETNHPPCAFHLRQSAEVFG
jgi:hypothetical protein